LSNISDLDPPPLLYGLFATHPSTTERIALARDWARLHDVAPPAPLVATAATAAATSAP
jgi:STE24 endopeptidase